MDHRRATWGVEAVLARPGDEAGATAVRRVLRICRAQACRAEGAERLWAYACGTLGLPPRGGTTADGRTTLEAWYCPGACHQSPVAALDGDRHPHMDLARLNGLLAREAHCPVEEAAL